MVSDSLSTKVDGPTCRDTKERKEGDGNPFCGNVTVLEQLLVEVGAVRTFRLV
jgi:hypothetical protein